MIQPLLQDDAFLADVAKPPASPDELRVWWVGQSGYLLRYGGHFALLDPYLTDSITRKYAATDKPHVRMTEIVIAPERLVNLEVITSSHNHTDHLDDETLIPLLRANPQARLVIPEANRAFVANRLGIEPAEPIGLDDGASATVGAFTFHGIAAAHPQLQRDAAGRCHFLGYIIRCGRWTIYHSGDTLLFPGLVEKVRAFAPIDLALLPINGDVPARRVDGNLDGREAAQLAHDIGARCVVPCHYEMFAFNTEDPATLFVPECERLGQPYQVLSAGEAWCSPA